MVKHKHRSRTNFPRSLTCEERVDQHLKERIVDLRRLWKTYEKGIEKVPNLGTLPEYGLAFEFIVSDLKRGSGISYFRYQLSCGGPSDEFRFFAMHDGRAWKAVRIEYWFDRAKRVLRGTRLEFMRTLFAWFDEGSITRRVYREATEE